MADRDASPARRGLRLCTGGFREFCRVTDKIATARFGGDACAPADTPAPQRTAQSIADAASHPLCQRPVAHLHAAVAASRSPAAPRGPALTNVNGPIAKCCRLAVLSVLQRAHSAQELFRAALRQRGARSARWCCRGQTWALLWAPTCSSWWSSSSSSTTCGACRCCRTSIRRNASYQYPSGALQRCARSNFDPRGRALRARPCSERIYHGKLHLGSMAVIVSRMIVQRRARTRPCAARFQLDRAAFRQPPARTLCSARRPRVGNALRRSNARAGVSLACAVGDRATQRVGPAKRTHGPRRPARVGCHATPHHLHLQAPALSCCHAIRVRARAKPAAHSG